MKNKLLLAALTLFAVFVGWLYYVNTNWAYYPNHAHIAKMRIHGFRVFVKLKSGENVLGYYSVPSKKYIPDFNFTDPETKFGEANNFILDDKDVRYEYFEKNWRYVYAHSKGGPKDFGWRLEVYPPNLELRNLVDYIIFRKIPTYTEKTMIIVSGEEDDSPMVFINAKGGRVDSMEFFPQE